MRRAAFILSVLLAACQREESVPEADEGVTVSQSPVVNFALDAEGLRLVDPQSGSTRLLPFGTAREEAEAAFGSATSEEAERTQNAECGAGPMEFTSYGPFQLNFQDGELVGWSAGAGATAGSYATMDGIGIGSLRAEVEDRRSVTMLEDSTLGEEFLLAPSREEAGIAGTFSAPGPNGQVEALWAGVACNFR